MMSFPEMKIDSIPEFYAGKKLFITGATGFLGRVLVEKLLRDCKGISKIYLLIRFKKGVDPQARAIEFLNHMVFDKIRKEDERQLDKIQVIAGDVTVDGLMLSDTDHKMLVENVDLLFHSAANVRFDLPVKDAINFNTTGTLRVLQLATKFTHFQGFIYVSTVFCQCNEKVLEEKYYPASENPYSMIKMSQNLSPDILEQITPKLLNGLPNTYTFSKALSEDLVHSFKDKFPIAICRASLINGAWKEPFEGWLEGNNGVTDIIVGAWRGVIRSLYAVPDNLSEYIPVDFNSNAIIAAGRHILKQEKSNEVFYCNITDSGRNPISWENYIELGKITGYANPLKFTIWYPDGTIKNNYYLHMLCILFLHFLPAYIIDLLLFIAFRKPFMVKLQRKIYRGLKAMQFFTTVKWIFRNENYQKLQAEMNDKDKETFYMDTKLIDWNEHVKNYFLGIRLFLLKETPDSIPKARVTLRRLYILHRITTFIIYGSILYILWNYLGNIANVTHGLFQGTKDVVSSFPLIRSFNFVKV